MLGCSICLTALAEWYLPPIWLWIALSVTWYISNAIVHISTLDRGASLSLLGLVAKLIVCVLIGAAVLGMGFMLILILPSAIRYARGLRKNGSEHWIRANRHIRTIGAGHLTAIACVLALTTYIRSTRRTEEFIVRWEHSAPAVWQLERLRDQEPASLEAYRYIVRNGEGWIVAKAAERLGEIGERAVDLDLLETACLRFPELEITNALSALRTRSPALNLISTQPNGPASERQPVRPATNRASSAADSRRSP